MGIILGALGGAGKAAGEIADSNTRLWNAQDLAVQAQQLDIAKHKAIEQFRNENTEAQRTKMVGAIDTGAQGIVNDKFIGHEVADPSTWTSEQQAALDQGKALMLQNPRTRSVAAARLGYTDEALKLDKIAESGASTVPFGSTRVDSEGNVVYDNGSMLKGSIAQQGADAKTAGTKGGVKRLDPAKVAQIVETMGSKADLPPNPFLDPQAVAANNGKKPVDEVGRSAFTQLFGKEVEDGGEDGNLTAAMNTAKGKYGKLNTAITQRVSQDFQGGFDRHGAWSAGEAATKGVLAKYGFDPTSMTRYEVLSEARAAAMRQSVDRLVGGDVLESTSAPPAVIEPKKPPPPAKAPPPKPAPAPRALPRTLADIPGVVDEGVVSAGTDLSPNLSKYKR